MPRFAVMVHSLLAALIAAEGAFGGEVKVAVAANFTAVMNEIAPAFEADSGHDTVVSYGSTGKLYAQITQGAPFEVFLAADQARPQRLVEAGRAEPAFTYAIGELVLWSSDPDRIGDDGAAVLRAGDYRYLAIANPKTAPYGAAAVQILEALGLRQATAARLVQGNNIAQTYQFVLTKNAELGFVARSQVVLDARGSRWIPPQSLYDPIRQDGVRLTQGQDNPAAQAFVRYLQGPEARAVIRKYGYAVESSDGR